MESPSFGLRLFGYNTSEVNEELSRVDREFYETLCDLEIKTCKYLGENQKLKEEIRALKRNRGSALQPQFLEAAVKNAGHFIELYQVFVNEETVRLKEKEQRITQLYNEKLAAIDREIKSTQKIIGMALESILNKASEIILSDLAEELATRPAASQIAEIADVKPVSTQEPAPVAEDQNVDSADTVYTAPEPEEIAAASAVEEAIKNALAPEAPQNESPSNEVSWGPIPKIEYITPLSLEDFEETQTVTAVSANPAVPSPKAPSPTLQSFKLNVPPLQTQTKNPATE